MVVVVDYGVGNLGSIQNMLKKVGAKSLISNQAEEIARAEKLILPGVGAFDRGMERLTASGLIPALRQRVHGDKVPLLGICVGMQLMNQSSEEGELPGLGWMDGQVVRFQVDEKALRVPHMGWNRVEPKGDCPLLAGMEDEARFYFAHSFHTKMASPDLVAATTDYGYSFASIVHRDNVWGVQFHPEKSHRFGLQLFKNFMGMSQ